MIHTGNTDEQGTGQHNKPLRERIQSLIEKGIFQGMKSMSCWGNVWDVKHGGQVMSAAYDGIYEGVAIPVCRLGVETLSSDRQNRRPDQWTPQVTAPNNPLFKPGSREHYVSKNSAHSFSRDRGKRNEWHCGGVAYLRV